MALNGVGPHRRGNVAHEVMLVEHRRDDGVHVTSIAEVREALELERPRPEPRVGAKPPAVLPPAVLPPAAPKEVLPNVTGTLAQPEPGADGRRHGLRAARRAVAAAPARFTGAVQAEPLLFLRRRLDGRLPEFPALEQARRS